MCMCIAVEIVYFASCIVECLLKQKLFQKAIDDAASFHKHKCYDCIKMHKIIILVFNRLQKMHIIISFSVS